MTKSRFQFGVRELLVLTLAMACFLGIWIAIDRMHRDEAKSLRQEVERYHELNQELMRFWEKSASEHISRSRKAEAENIRLKQKIGVLEHIIETQKAEIDEASEVVDRPQSNQ